MRNLLVENKLALSKMDEFFVVHDRIQYWHWNFMKKTKTKTKKTLAKNWSPEQVNLVQQPETQLVSSYSFGFCIIVPETWLKFLSESYKVSVCVGLYYYVYLFKYLYYVCIIF